ncbi:MAG: dihydrolipoyl dehydrogenase [Lachnospiraceae bacterium]|nr:dihydrolipoyl dehydrogenase [Lachnospiraceae bacterium]
MGISQKHVVVIGGGPGGYVAALRAAQLGAHVTLVEKKHLGGTCLNVGCIPTKALIHIAEFLNSIHESPNFGVKLSLEEINWSQVLSYKNSVVQTLVKGVEGLLRSNKINVINGTAQFIRPKTIEIQKADNTSEVLEADRIIVATGSVPVIPPIDGLKESHFVIDSTGALNMNSLPASMVIIGGGVIGIEMAYVLNAFGCNITIVEALPTLVPTMDQELAELLLRILEKQGVVVMLGCKVSAIIDGEQGAKVVVSTGGTETEIKAEKVLCAVGRRPYTEDLSPDLGGIKTEKGRILVNEYLETTIPGVYAIGDCVGKTMLAHTAYAMGELAAENAMGEHLVYNPNCVPVGIYGFPEMASVGLTEEQAKEKKISYHVGRFPLSGNGRALIANGGEGMVKVLIGDELDEILGVHILAPNAMEMIGEGAVAIQMEGTAEELINTIHAHPTISEAIREAVLSSQGRAIHMPNKKKKGAG